MPSTSPEPPRRTVAKLPARQKLDLLLKGAKGKRRALILTHDNPDPDSIAAAVTLAHVLEKRGGMEARAAYGGIIGRAENLAMAKVLQRTQGVDLQAARAAAAAAPDDVDAQTLVADLDMLGGHVEDAFARLVELVRRTSDKERDRARDHLLGLFAAVGNDDPRVLNGRRALASALF